jgi:hypothetical protein
LGVEKSYTLYLIGLCADYFTAALENTHNPLVQHIAQKNIWLSLTHTILHELAYVWYSCFYAGARGASRDDEVWDGGFSNDEALVFLRDPLSEVGKSWKNFSLGASIHGCSSKLTLHQHLRSITWATAKYEHGSEYWIEAILPHVFVEQWFLKDTCENMSALRANGGLRAPTTDTDVSVVRMGRFVAGKSLWLWLVDVRTVYFDHKPELGLIEPGSNTTPWPADPKVFTDMYFDIWRKEGAYLSGEVYKYLYLCLAWWLAHLERIKRALIDQGMTVPNTVDDWAALYKRYKKDPFMLRTHICVIRRLESILLMSSHGRLNYSLISSLSSA